VFYIKFFYLLFKKKCFTYLIYSFLKIKKRESILIKKIICVNLSEKIIFVFYYKNKIINIKQI